MFCVETGSHYLRRLKVSFVVLNVLGQERQGRPGTGTLCGQLLRKYPRALLNLPRPSRLMQPAGAATLP